jgi:hypothetical protein
VFVRCVGVVVIAPPCGAAVDTAGSKASAGSAPRSDAATLKLWLRGSESREGLTVKEKKRVVGTRCLALGCMLCRLRE